MLLLCFRQEATWPRPFFLLLTLLPEGTEQYEGDGVTGLQSPSGCFWHRTGALRFRGSVTATSPCNANDEKCSWTSGGFGKGDAFVLTTGKCHHVCKMLLLLILLVPRC